jgi:hypothetical protein
VRWLILGPYPPEPGAGPAAAAAFVAERLAGGDSVHAVSPRPTAAHEHHPLEGLGGIRALWQIVRAQHADGLWWRVEPGILLRHTVDRRRGLLERAALVLALRRFDTAILDVGDVGLLPGGRAGRPVLAAATRFVVHSPKDAETLVANGAARDRIDVAGPAAEAPEPAFVSGPEPTYPPPTQLHDLTGSREVIEAAVHRRADELRAARNPDPPATGG